MVTKKRAARKQRPQPSQYYVAELEAENERLHVQLAKLRVRQLSLGNELKALQQELRENRPPVAMDLSISRDTPQSIEEKERRLRELAEELGFDLAPKAG